MSGSTAAQRAESFVLSIGVNQHVGFLGTVYSNVQLELQDLAYLGISLVRDQAPSSATLSLYQQLATSGVKFDLITSPAGQDLANTLPTDISETAALAQSNPGSVLSVEGPNELNGGQVVYLNGQPSTNASVGAQMEQDVSQSVRGNPVLSAQGVKVVNVSINNGGAGWQNYVAGLGNLDPYVDYANWHVYFNAGAQPAAAVTSMYQNAEQSAPGKPVLFTEAGYSSAYADGNAVDQATQAKNTLNLLADAYKAGVQQTFLYELMEGVANPASNDTEDSFGLFTSNGTAKPVATAIHDLTSILADTASNATTFATGSLNYSITNLPSTGNSMLLEKASGAFDLMVWNEAPDWNEATQSEIAVAPTNAVVNLGATYATVKLFDPLQSSNPVQTFSNVSSVTLGLTDHPLIIEIEPNGGSNSSPSPTPTPTPAPTPSPNNTIILAGSASAITDASGNQWTITAGGQVAVNGVADTTTSSVIELAYENGLVWQENVNDLWWSKTSPTAAWVGGTATSPVPAPVTPSPNNTIVLAGSTSAITDASGNKWTITSAGQVAVNGVADTTTSSVIELAYENGLVWQENVNDLWWSKTSPTATWVGGTATSPVPAPVTPSPNNTIVLVNSTNAITDASGNKWTINTAGQVAVNGVADTTTSSVIELAYENGLVWQENVNDLWWSKSSPTAAWVGGTATSPVPVTTSPDNTVVLIGAAGTITDTSGNKWTLTAGGQVAVNGVADTTTSGVVELDYTKGLIWQENNKSLWWSKTSPSAAWAPTPGTATPPIAITVTSTASKASMVIDATKVQTLTDFNATFSLTAPGVANVTLGATPDTLTFTSMSSISLTAGSAAAIITADRGTNTFTAGTGTLDVTGGSGADNYIYHSGNARLTIEDFSAANGDTLTIDSALKSALVTTSDGHGGTLLTFGSGGGIDLKSVTTLPATAVHWQ